jgi:hypothetical protein
MLLAQGSVSDGVDRKAEEGGGLDVRRPIDNAARRAGWQRRLSQEHP